MLGITHALIGLALAKALGLAGFDSYFRIVLVIFFAVLPDIDVPRSEIGRIFPPISKFLYSKFGHRNITHSLIFLLGVSNLFVLWRELWLMAVISIGAHLISDMLTYTGVPLLWPFHKNFNIFGGPLLTGRWTEGVICVIAGAVFVFASTIV